MDRDWIELVNDPRFLRVRRWMMILLRTYFRVEVSGLEHLPKSGRVIIAPNHSGYAGADAIMLNHVIRRHTGRRARILAHRSFFDFSETVRTLAESFGMKRASFDNGVRILKRDYAIAIFPEGEAGNFKPSTRRYRLQRFHTGFVRMAVAARSPIVPVLIIGAEETHLNLGNIDLGRWIKGLRIPLPVNLIPLPAKWEIHFLPPISPKDLPSSSETSPAELERLARKIRKDLQHKLSKSLRARRYVYFKETRVALLKAQRKIRKAKASRPSKRG